MAQQIQQHLKDRMPAWQETHPGVEEMRVAVMGCVVNGPGESKHADIGISLPGTFEDPVAPVFIDGKLDRTLRGEGLVAEFIGILEDYVDRRYPAALRSRPRPDTDRGGQMTATMTFGARRLADVRETEIGMTTAGDGGRARSEPRRPVSDGYGRPGCHLIGPSRRGLRRHARVTFEPSTHPGV